MILDYSLLFFFFGHHPRRHDEPAVLGLVMKLFDSLAARGKNSLSGGMLSRMALSRRSPTPRQRLPRSVQPKKNFHFCCFYGEGECCRCPCRGEEANFLFFFFSSHCTRKKKKNRLWLLCNKQRGCVRVGFHDRVRAGSVI